MKNFFYLTLVAFISLSTIGCGESKAEREARLEEARQEGIREAQRMEQERRELEQREFEQKRMEREESQQRRTFTTSFGTYDTEKFLDICYQKGIDNGNTFGKPSSRFPNGMEPQWKDLEHFKMFFSQNFGIPKGHEAEEAFHQGYEKYLEGWNDAINF